MSFKPRYKLAQVTRDWYLFTEVEGLYATHYLMPRWRWAVMCEGRWPWR